MLRLIKVDKLKSELPQATEKISIYLTVSPSDAEAEIELYLTLWFFIPGCSPDKFFTPKPLFSSSSI